MKWLWIVLLLTGVAYAGENCAFLGGVCRDACTETEVEEPGAFIDCTQEQVCCFTEKEKEELALKCCIYSFDSRNYSRNNCGIPEDNECVKGTGSPRDCAELAFCRDK